MDCKLLFGSFFAIVAMAVSTPVAYSDIHIPNLCRDVHCAGGRVCRPVMTCTDEDQCAPEAKCVECVPESIDRVCNRKGMIFGVAYGDFKLHKDLKAMECYAPSFKCPAGTRCLTSDSMPSRGVCCWSPDPEREPKEYVVSNCDRKCLSCVPSCQSGYTCKQDLTTSCRKEKSYCSPNEKPGHCLTNDCPENMAGRKIKHCSNDQDCTMSDKCCEQCGMKVCTTPVMY